MGTDDTSAPPTARDPEAIFEDLRTLTRRDGALHDISAIVYRDWVVTVDVKEARVADAPEKRWSTDKLNNDEMMLLLGLLVQSPTDRTFSVVNDANDFATTADTLLREFHNRLLVDAVPKHGDIPTFERKLGAVAREAIYYGPDSFYLHQFWRLARDRYREDLEWLVRNVGISARPMVEIARFIVERISHQMTGIGLMQKRGDVLSKGELTNSLLVPKSALFGKFGDKADAFVRRFATAVVGSNGAFNDPFAVNQVSLAPLIDLGQHIYVPNSYRLFESIYESPFYWMMGDQSYVNKAAEHRGAFLERTATKLLSTVFGTENVHRNVMIRRNKQEIAGEADVLVTYGEFVIVVQAKSKRVTLKARSGDEAALLKDFEGAIQAPYRQAYEFAELIRSGAECLTTDGKTLTFSPTVRAFPAVILSDEFPAAVMLSSVMLRRSKEVAPVIWDLGILDCITRMLPTPIDFLYYLKCRSDLFDRVYSDSEYNFLGFHLKYKLAMAPDIDGMMLERDFAGVVDDFMVPQDLGVKVTRPLSIFEQLDIPVISHLLERLRTAPPRLASVVIDLYDFSHDALSRFAATIETLRTEVAAGKDLKAFSILTESGGLTYVVCRAMNRRVRTAAEMIGKKHKYDRKRDRWYVVVDSVATSEPVDALLPLTEKWREDSGLEENSRQVERLFGSRWESI